MDLDPAVVSMILGFLVTFVTSLVKKYKWSGIVRTAAFAAVAVVAGVLQNLGTLTWEDLGQSFVVIFTTAQLFYGLYFSGTKANEKLEEIGNPPK